MAAEELKQRGNELYKQQKYAEAIEQYGKALDFSIDDPVLLSNRSVAYWKLGDYGNALKDAQKCIAVKPDWVKGYLRMAVALNCLKKYQEAKDTSILGFCFNDLKFTKDFVMEWLKASKALTESDISELLLSQPYCYFYPDGIDLINTKYCEILVSIIVPLMPSQSRGVLGLSHDDMVKCLCSTVQLLEDLLVEFKQQHYQCLSEWKDKVIFDVDAFNPESQTELLTSVDKKSLELASWLQNDLPKALLPVVKPIMLLAVKALLSRSLCLRCMNAGAFSLEYIAHSCLPFFENCIFSESLYTSTHIEVLFLILYSYGSIEFWTKDMLQAVQTTQARIQQLIAIMPKSTKTYDLLMEEYSENLSVFLNMDVTGNSDSQFSHNPVGTATDLEHILLVDCVEDPRKARQDVENHLHVILEQEAENEGIFIDAQNLFFMTSIFVKLGDSEKGLEIYQKAFSVAQSIMMHLVENDITSLEEVATVVGSLRHFALCGASFLLSSHPKIACDAFIRWKNLYAEVFSILIRLGLNSNNNLLFQLLSNPAIQKEEMDAFKFHNIREKMFTKKHFAHVIRALMAQNHDQVLALLDSADVVLDYVFDIYHPDFNPKVQQRNDPVCYVCILEKKSPPKIIKIDVAPLHKSFSNQVGKPVSFDKVEDLCSELSKAIFPPDVCKILSNSGIKRLLICGDSYLHDLPLEVCSWVDVQTGTTVQLCERFDIVRLTSPRELLRENVVSSLRLIFNPLVDLSYQPSITNVAAVLKATKSVDLEMLPISVEELLGKAIVYIGHTTDSLLQQAEMLKSLSYKCGDQLHPSKNFMAVIQQTMTKVKEKVKARAEEFKLQCKCKIIAPTMSLNTMCYFVGNPDFKLCGSNNVGKSVGWISSLTSMFGLAAFNEPAIKFESLPGTQKEIEEVKQLLSLNPHLDIKEPIVKDAATVDNVLSLESPFILHIATHGHLRSSIHTQARKSHWHDTSTALLLAGAETYLNEDYSKLSSHINVGCLTPATVCAINLEGTRLVFLSACKSGIGDKPFHETSESILQAFRSVGAQTVISTLWSVDDSTTVDVASLFYKYLMEDPTSNPSHALALTKRHLIKQKEPFSVYAAFTCSGLDHSLHPSSVSEAQSIEMVCKIHIHWFCYFTCVCRLQTTLKLNIRFLLS